MKLFYNNRPQQRDCPLLKLDKGLATKPLPNYTECLHFLGIFLWNPLKTKAKYRTLSKDYKKNSNTISNQRWL